MAYESRNSILTSIAPRGTNPRHIEHEAGDEIAMCVYDNNKLVELHTPVEILKRIHETMHMRLTDNARARRQYKNVHDIVGQITEDVRIHTHVRGWPWAIGATPDKIAVATLTFAGQETGIAQKDQEEGKPAWGIFARRFRAAAIRYGITREYPRRLFRDTGMSGADVTLADRALDLISRKKEGLAAELLQAAFFPPPPPIDKPGKDGPDKPGKRGGRRRGRVCGLADPPMQIIELMHTVPLIDGEDGFRRTSSGPRLDRAAIRRPVLPARCFIRRVPLQPGGTILIDASSSMGDFEQVRKQCEAAPFATVAYYAGYDAGMGGYLYVYARDGYRAEEVVEPPCSGNCVDGPALTWLLTQQAPRIIVTDRGFCGAGDSEAQIVRLQELERAGEVQVRDYRRTEED